MLSCNKLFFASALLLLRTIAQLHFCYMGSWRISLTAPIGLGKRKRQNPDGNVKCLAFCIQYMVMHYRMPDINDTSPSVLQLMAMGRTLIIFEVHCRTL